MHANMPQVMMQIDQWGALSLGVCTKVETSTKPNANEKKPINSDVP
jgi:hypothetical protein